MRTKLDLEVLEAAIRAETRLKLFVESLTCL